MDFVKKSIKVENPQSVRTSFSFGGWCFVSVNEDILYTLMTVLSVDCLCFRQALGKVK